MNILTDRPEILTNLASLFLRLILGISMFYHGSQKILGWFGGKGLAVTAEGMHLRMGLPVFLIYVSFFTELFGAIAMLSGTFTRFFALLIIVNMIVATSVSLPKGFGGGYELPLVVLVLAVAVLLLGPGTFSIDQIFAR